MTPHYSDDWLTVYGGDVRDVLPTLAADSVDCIVTSPPYWGLRDYGTATWIGGDEACRHEGDGPAIGNNMNVRGRGETEMPVGGWVKAETNGNQYRAVPNGGVCAKCGAIRQDGQLGLEATPEQYVANLVGVFRELRRVLKPSGTCWLNLGDSYNNRSVARKSSHHGALGFESADLSKSWAELTTEGRTRLSTNGGPWSLKEKDLVGIPWRVAFALQADGWWLRSDIIWSKPNPMPESVTDRPTKAHEYLFLLTRSARYYYDADAVAEATLPSSIARYAYGDPATTRINKGGDYREAWNNGDKHIGVPTVPDNPATRNLRSVWTIATRPYPGAHFAVFPPELPERCIKAGSSERGVCPECGAPWERVVERSTVLTRPGLVSKLGTTEAERRAQGRDTTVGLQFGPETTFTTTGWEPSCGHTMLNPTGAVVLDPFAGSGTVGLVANRLSRRAILIDLNPAYLEQQMKRNAQTVVGL